MDTNDSVRVEPMMDTYTQPVPTKRQYRSLEEKQRIVGEALAEGASVARVARAHGVNANLVFNWCRLYRAGRLRRRSEAALLRVRVAAESSTLPAASMPEPGRLLATSGGPSTSNCGMRKYMWKAGPIQFCCVCCWSVCNDDHSTQQHADMDRRRGD